VSSGLEIGVEYSIFEVGGYTPITPKGGLYTPLGGLCGGI